MTDQLKYRHKFAIYPLNVCLSIILLTSCSARLWGFWIYQETEWTIGSYVVILIPALVAAALAHLLRVEPRDEFGSAEEQYLRIARPFWLIATVIPIMQIIHINYFAQELVFDSLVNTARYGFAVLLLSLSVFVNVKYHWFALAVVFGWVIFAAVRTVPTLS